MPLEDPFRHQPWTEGQASLADRVWRLHDMASSDADQQGLLDLSTQLGHELDHIPDVQHHLTSIASTSLASFPAAAKEGETAEWIRRYAASLGRVLAGIAGIKSEWQLAMVDDLAKGFFYSRRILNYHDEVGAGLNIFRDASERLLWRESVRAKNFLADGVPLGRDLPGKFRVEVKRSVLVTLEYLRLAEKVSFDPSISFLNIGYYHRAQIALLARFGRATFKS